MIRIAIVEDEDSYVQVLTGYLKQYETEHSLSFQISVFHDGLDIVSEYKADYDIILLDIQMKHLDGMKTAEKIRELDEDVSFIFITSTIQFAVQGYLVDALGYVVKPVAYLAFSQILGKAVKKVKQKQQKDYMTIEVEGGQMRLDISQIYWSYVKKKYKLNVTNFLCSERSLTCYFYYILLDVFKILFLIFIWRQISTMTVNAHGIVKCFDVFKNQFMCMCIIKDFKPVDPFSLQKCMERFYTGVIPWICFL